MDPKTLWIGYYGRLSEPVLITAHSEDDALDIATRLSMQDGCLDDDLADTTWVIPYDRDTAEEEGLAELGPEEGE